MFQKHSVEMHLERVSCNWLQERERTRDVFAGICWKRGFDLTGI